jgi:hypothetical protein
VIEKENPRLNMAKIFPGRMQNNLDEHEERENVEKQNLFSDGEILIRKICRDKALRCVGATLKLVKY